jgi:hypothetical protein
MVRSALAAFAAVAMLAASASAETPALNAAFAQMQQGFKAASAILRNAALAPKTAAQAAPAVRTREFNVDHRDRRWRLVPNPNPPGSDLTIDVTVGDKVKLSFFNWGNSRGGDESAQFNVRGIDAVVNGSASNGIYVWLSWRGDTAIVEFDAVKAGIYPIDGASGYIIIRAKK